MLLVLQTLTPPLQSIITCFNKDRTHNIFSGRELNDDIAFDLYDVFSSLTHDNKILLSSNDVSEIHTIKGAKKWVPNMHKVWYASCIVGFTEREPQRKPLRKHTIMNNSVISVIQVKEEQFEYECGKRVSESATSDVIKSSSGGRPDEEHSTGGKEVTHARNVDDDNGSVAINANSDVSSEGSEHESDADMFGDDDEGGSHNQSALDNAREAEDDERLQRVAKQRYMYYSDEDDEI
jgi:hypothetical protein